MKSIKTNGPRLRELREGRHWTQEQLAEVSGVGLRTIQRAERGEALDARSLSTLAEALGADPSELLLPEAPRTQELLFLPAVDAALQLQEIAGCHARLVAHDEPETAEQRAAIGAFFDGIEDANMIWSDISPSARLEAGASLLESARALEAAGLCAFATVREKEVAMPTGAPVLWRVAHIVVTRSDNPCVMRGSDLTKSVGLFAEFPIKPKIDLSAA